MIRSGPVVIAIRATPGGKECLQGFLQFPRISKTLRNRPTIWVVSVIPRSTFSTLESAKAARWNARSCRRKVTHPCTKERKGHAEYPCELLIPLISRRTLGTTPLSFGSEPSPRNVELAHRQSGPGLRVSDRALTPHLCAEHRTRLTGQLAPHVLRACSPLTSLRCPVPSLFANGGRASG
jgi:hypothetical protein